MIGVRIDRMDVHYLHYRQQGKQDQAHDRDHRQSS
jgi:hypothetical protein